nr:orf 5' of meg1 - mouse [Mus musculus]
MVFPRLPETIAVDGLSLQDNTFCTESGRRQNFSEVGAP